MKALPLAGLALAGTLVLAACGGASSAPAATPTTAAAGPARKVDVTATNDLYSIKTLEVKTGERIEFVLKNEGDEKHNVVAIGEGVSIASPDFDAGQTLSWTWTAPSKPQTFKFICAYHAQIPPILVSVK